MNSEIKIEQQNGASDDVGHKSTAGPQPTPLEQTITAVAPTLIANILASFKKIGMPATVAAIVSVLVTVTPFLFKIDERYAKAAEVQATIDQIKEDRAKLTAEVGRIAGAVEILSEIVGQQYRTIQEINQTQARSSREPVRHAVFPAPAPPASRAQILAAGAPPPTVVVSKEESEEIQSDENTDVSKTLDQIRRNLEQSRKNLDSIQEDAE